MSKVSVVNITCNTRLGNAEMIVLLTLVGAIFGQEKEIEYLEGGKSFKIDGDAHLLEMFLAGIHGNWTPRTLEQGAAFAFYPGGLNGWYHDLPRLKSKITLAEIMPYATQ